MKIAIVGAGWAGLAAAVQATQAGHTAIIFEASHSIGGRARSINGMLPDGQPVVLDNGQHILLGAYSQALRLMQSVGVDLRHALLRMPLRLEFPNGQGLRLPNWPNPFAALAAIVGARGWSAADKWSLLRAASSWQGSGFESGPQTCVSQLCCGVTPRAMTELIEPLCVSALNTPADQASAQVFLRVIKDALFGPQGSSDLLLPKINLSDLFPNPAVSWLGQHGVELRCGTRVDVVSQQGTQWLLNGSLFDAVVIATPLSDALRLLKKCTQAAPESLASSMHGWINVASKLRCEAITTVYAWGPGATLSHPMLTLRSANAPGARPAPAQFVFDRGQLGGPAGLLAFVVSASDTDRSVLQAHVLAQADDQLGMKLQAVQTVVEKRATFACTPGVHRPDQRICPGLVACGDYVAGPYPATLEGTVRSAEIAVQALVTKVGENRA